MLRSSSALAGESACLLQAPDVELDFASGRSDEESFSLSGLMYLAAIRIVQATGSMGALLPTNKSILDGNVATSADLYQISCELYWRLAEFLPHCLLPALPSPDELNRKFWRDAWQELNDPAIADHWQDESSLGFAYQYFCTPVRRQAQDDLQRADKQLTLRSLISFTQLYTPDWVVDFLVQNTLGSLWAGSKSDQGSVYRAGRKVNGSQQESVHKLRLIDPACGSGHFLLKAFDILLPMYRAEGWSQGDATASILAENLCGVDIDPIGLWITALALMLKQLRFGDGCSGVQAKLSHVQNAAETASGVELLGSLAPGWRQLEGHPLSSHYHVVVTNPPYIGRKLLDRRLKMALKAEFPDCHQDLCAAFLRRGLDLLYPGGRLGLIGQSSLLFLPSYGKLRQYLIEQTNLVSVVELGPGVFPLQGGEKVNSSLFVVEVPVRRREPGKQSDKDASCAFLDVVASKDKATALGDLLRQEPKVEGSAIYYKDQYSFKRQRKCALNYKCPEVVIEIIESCQRLGDMAELRQGLATSDNKRFVRHWWDVDPAELGHRWFPYVKGAGSQRWWAPVEYVVDWRDNGSAIKEAVNKAYPYLNGNTNWVVKNEQFYFREGLTFSFVNSRGLAVRRLPPGCIFDVGGSALFAPPEMLDFLLGYLNSSFVGAVSKLLNPTINFQVGDLKEIPVLPFDDADMAEIAGIAGQCCVLTQFLHEPYMVPVRDSVPPVVAALIGSAEPETIWQDYSSRFCAAQQQLVALEDRLNGVVLQKVRGRWVDSAGKESEVVTWIAEQSSLSKSKHVLKAGDFAKFIVSQLLHLQLKESQTVSFDSGTCEQLLGIKEAVRRWLEAQLGLPLFQYFAEQFVADSRIRYHGAPCVQCIVPNGGSNAPLTFMTLRPTVEW